MSAFQNTIDLRFAVSDLVGNRAISDVFPRLVEMAEVDFNSRLRTRHQITDYTMVFDEGVAALPPDFLELIHLNCKTNFQIDGFNVTIPSYSGEMNVQYYARIPALCTPTSSNWLLCAYPNAYLYGVGLQAAKHLRSEELAVPIASLYSEAMGLIRVDDERARYSTAKVRVQGPTP